MKLSMEMGKLSKRQKPDHRAVKSLWPLMGLHHSDVYFFSDNGCHT